MIAGSPFTLLCISLLCPELVRQAIVFGWIIPDTDLEPRIWMLVIYKVNAPRRMVRVGEKQDTSWELTKKGCSVRGRFGLSLIPPGAMQWMAQDLCPGCSAGGVRGSLGLCGKFCRCTLSPSQLIVCLPESRSQVRDSTSSLFKQKEMY